MTTAEDRYKEDCKAAEHRYARALGECDKFPDDAGARGTIREAAYITRTADLNIARARRGRG